MKQLIVILLAALSAVACTKVRVDCQYSVTPYTLAASGGTSEAATDVVALSFGLDTAEWTIANYADAVEGNATSRLTGQKESFDQQELLNTDGQFVFNFTSKPQMIVVYSTALPMYAWRGSNVENNLDKMNVSLTFQTWLTETSVTLKGWTYCYETMPITPVEPDPGTSDGSSSDNTQ